MTNQELLQKLSARINTGSLTSEQVLAQVSGTQGSTLVEKGRTFNLTKLFYILGGVVALIGIIFFTAQIWDDLGAGGRIFVTLILGLILAGIGSFFLRTKPASHLGEVWHGLAGFLIPGGALVTFHEIVGLDYLTSLWPVTIIFGIIFLFYLLLNFYHRNVVLTFFTIANGTALFYLLIESIISGPLSRHFDVYAYLTMIVGLSYLLLAYAWRASWNKHLVSILNFLGSVGFLGAAFNRVIEGAGFWEFLFFALAGGGMALAVFVIRSRLVLLISTLFLVVHFIYITKEYFADSIGWPILLVILGFIFIGLGYFSISLGRKYIS
ncbi:MAG: hypothetical protein V1704_03755 [Candidatus Vogelbacteria bacterium]